MQTDIFDPLFLEAIKPLHKWAIDNGIVFMITTRTADDYEPSFAQSDEMTSYSRYTANNISVLSNLIIDNLEARRDIRRIQVTPKHENGTLFVVWKVYRPSTFEN